MRASFLSNSGRLHLESLFPSADSTERPRNRKKGLHAGPGKGVGNARTRTRTGPFYTHMNTDHRNCARAPVSAPPHDGIRHGATR